jgi:hypothetical protein
MLIRRKITTFIFSIASVIFLWPTITLAQFGEDALDNISVATTKDIFDIIVGYVNIVLYFLGTIAVLLFLYAGWLWFTSQGSSEKIEKAKKIMVSAVIGLAIMFGSYAIVNWIFNDAIRSAFFEGGSGGRRYGGGAGLGAGVIESHYPEPNATSIPRNTNIYITFKEPMEVGTIASGSGCTTDATTGQLTCPIVTSNIRLHQNIKDAVNVEDMTVTYDPADRTVFEFNPYGMSTIGIYLLGEQTKDTKYEMALFNLRTETGRQAFSSFSRNTYSWRFTVGTYSDNTPPRVTSVRPKEGVTAPRNAIVQINFSEAINPTLATGIYDGASLNFDNITLTHGTTPVVTEQGRYVISNQYRTVEFIPNERCGTNSCGYDVFCLAASINDFIGTVTTDIRDMAGNALASNYVWNFKTSDTIDLVPPKMVTMSPTEADLAPLPDPVKMTFDKPLFSRSVNSTNVQLFQETATPIDYWLALGDSEPRPGVTLENSVINIRHNRFEVNTNYLATSTSGIMDENQNCWYPCRCEGADCRCDTIDTSSILPVCGTDLSGNPFCQTPVVP